MSADRTNRLVANMRELRDIFLAIREDAIELDIDSLNEYIMAYIAMQNEISKFIEASVGMESLEY